MNPGIAEAGNAIAQSPSLTMAILGVLLAFLGVISLGLIRYYCVSMINKMDDLFSRIQSLEKELAIGRHWSEGIDKRVLRLEDEILKSA